MMRQALTEGCGFQFRFVDVAFPEIADVRAALSRAARQVLKVTLFISAKGAGVLGAHYDSNPVGIVPLFGRKLWKVGSRLVVRHPFAEVSRLNGRELLACKPNAVTLGQGSVLFVPGGHPHVVKTISDVAAHLTFSADVRSWAPTRLAVIAEVGRIFHELGSELPRDLAKFFGKPRDLETDEGLIAFFSVLPEVNELMNGDPAFGGLQRIWNIANQLYQPPWGRALWGECHSGLAEPPPYPYRGTAPLLQFDGRP